MLGLIIGCVFMCPNDKLCAKSLKSSVEEKRWEIEDNNKNKEGIEAKKG